MEYMLFMIMLTTWFRIVASCAYGEGCRYPCRCESGSCDPITGDCSDGCALSPPLNTSVDIGWKNSGCRIGNIAHHKTTNQSGVYANYTSELAVDGSIDPDLKHGHCAHPNTGLTSGPPAWWMVDLGKKHVIQKIVIFNRATNKYRTNDFYIRIGMTPVIANHDSCVYYNGGEKDVLILTCTTGSVEGRYVSMQRRQGSSEDFNINICEFIVIGYEPIECNDKCTGTCNDLEGCDMCVARFNLPDCVDECSSSTWGPDCLNNCGSCAENKPCDNNNGECKEGCSLWYYSMKCDRFIAKPLLKDSKVLVNVTSSSGLVVIWQQYKVKLDGLNGLGEHYFYRIKYGPTAGDNILSQKVEHNISIEFLHLELYDLAYNMEYEVKVVPYRIQGDFEEAGVPSDTVVDNTDCSEPSEPSLNVTAKNDTWLLYFTPKANLDYGCDDIISYTLYGAHENIVVLRASVLNSSSLKPVYEEAEVWVVAVNNENIRRLSRKHVLLVDSDDLRKYDSTQNKTVLIVGCVIGVLGGGALVVGLVLTFRRSERCTKANRNAEVSETYENTITDVSPQTEMKDITQTGTTFERNTGVNNDYENAESNPNFKMIDTNASTYESLDPRETIAGQTVYQTIE